MRSRAEAWALALEASLLALAACLGLLESAILPPLPIPGMRLGLANLAVLVALVALGPASAVRVSLGRVLIVGLATGALVGPASLMSIAGALAAVTVMSALARFGGGRFSVVGLSLAGSAAHLAGQVLFACVLVGSGAPLALFPLSLAASVLSGLAIGYSARLLLSRIPSRYVSFA